MAEREEITELYKRFDALRKEKGKKSLKQVSTDTGIAVSTIIDMKNTNRSLTNLVKLADYLGVSTDYLLGRTENRFSDKQSYPPYLQSIIEVGLQMDLDQTMTKILIKIMESLNECANDHE